MKCIRLIFVVMLLLLFCGCCNFASLEGDGTASRLAWEAYLPATPVTEVEHIRMVAEQSDVQLTFERGAYIGYTAKVNRGFKWKIPFEIGRAHV